jgi:TolA-binding protein
VHSVSASLRKLRTRLTGRLRGFALPGAGSALRGVSLAFRPVLLSISILGWTGCSKITMLRTQELRKVEDEVKATEKQIETLQKSVDELNLAQGGSTSKMKADLTLMLNQLESQITRLHAEIDETQYRLTQLSAKIDKLDQKKIIVGSGVAGQPGQPGAPAGTPGATATPGTAVPGTEARVVEGLDLEAMFNQARDDYIRGKYDLAMTGFKTVYEKDAGGTWRELAMFWMGETLMKQDKPDKALEAYGRVVKEIPRGTKSCSARFKSGLIYNQKKDKAKRDEEWSALIKECPGTNEAQRAQELQKE